MNIKLLNQDMIAYHQKGYQNSVKVVQHNNIRSRQSIPTPCSMDIYSFKNDLQMMK